LKRTFTLFLCLFCLAFLVLSPSLIVDGVHKNIYTIREKKKSAAYQGTLSLWHIVSFKTGGTSGVSFLADRIAAYEKRHSYVFIELTPLTLEEAEAKLQTGEFPDLVSFPLGFLGDTETLAALPSSEDSLLPAYAACGDQGATYAYPYMADCYLLSLNRDLFSTYGVPAPLDTVLSYENFIAALHAFSAPEQPETAVSALSLSTIRGLHPAAALLHLKTVAEEGELFVEELPLDQPIGSFDLSFDGGVDAFLDEKAAMLLSPASESEQLLLDKRANSLSVASCSISHYSDMVQLIAVAQTEDDAKYEMCLGFAQLLLSPASQNKLEAMKMLPVIPLEAIYEGQTLQLEEYNSLGSEGRIPNNFSLHAHQDTLDDALRQALLENGMASAKLENQLFD